MNAFWYFIHWLAMKPRIYKWLYKTIETNPYWPIKSPDGKSVYMWRGWVLKRDSWWQKLFGFNFCIRIHHIMREDMDRHQHSHPFYYRTLILKGWYVEQRKGNQWPRWLRAGDMATGSPDTFHNILEVSPGGVVTLFFMWGRSKDLIWGFDTENGFVPSDRYFKTRGDQNGDPSSNSD